MSDFMLECDGCGDAVHETDAEIVGSITAGGRDRAIYCEECTDR